MKTCEGVFKTFDGKKLRFHVHLSDPPAVDWMIGLHGHGEHIGRYQKFSDELKNEHVNLAFYDQRGYGLSEGEDVYVDSFEDFLRDVSAFIDFLEKEYKLPPKFILFGHSLGGLVAVNWAERHSEKLKALILSSPCFGLRLPEWVGGFNAFLNKFIPKFVYKNPVYPPHLTHNKDEVDAYKKDKLIKRRISVRLLDEMLLWSKKLKAAESFRFPFPVWMITAGIEKIVDSDCTRRFYDRLKAPAKDITVFDDFYHETFNEAGQSRAFEALRNYLRRTPK